MPKRWRLDGDAEELTRAIAILQEAVAGAERSRSRGAALTDLAVALSELFEYTGDLRHLDRAIELLDAVEAAEPGADRGNRAALLSRRYEAVGDPADLRAIAALRSASGAALSVRDERQRAAVLLTLHDQDGDPSDLDFAVESAARAVHEAGAAQRASALVNLGTALSGQYAAKGEVADLERAVEAYRDAVARTSQRSPRRALRLADLADAVRERAHRLGRASDLDEAVELLAAALQATPISAPGRPHRQSALATAMLDRCRRSRAGSGSRANDDRSLLDTAIELHRASLAALAKRAPVRFRHQQNLADALADRAVLSGDPDDRAAASLLFHRAFLGAAERDPWAAVVAARNWGAAASTWQDWVEAAQAYLNGLALLSRLVGAQRVRRHKEGWLRDAQQLPAGAALALARLGRRTEAVAALDTGRAVLLAGAADRAARQLSRVD